MITKMNVLKAICCAVLILPAVGEAATIAISIDSGAKSLRDASNVVLSGGAPGVNGDGAQVVLGYFTDATQAAPFGASGSDAFSSFVALTGPGTPFGVNFTIGDDAANLTGNGELFKDIFTISTGVADSILPVQGTPLVLRIFNSQKDLVLDLANTNGFWNWKDPATPTSTLQISMDNTGLVFRGVGTNNRSAVGISGGTVNLLTNNAVVPEPTSALLVSFGIVLLGSRRRRRD